MTVPCCAPHRMTGGLNNKMHSKELCNIQVSAQDVCVVVGVIEIMPLKILLLAGHPVPLSDSLTYSDPKVGKNRTETIIRKKSPEI